MNPEGSPIHFRAAFTIMGLAGIAGTILLTSFGYPAMNSLGVSVLAGGCAALLGGWGARRWADGLPLAALAFGASLLILGGVAAGLLVPRRFDLPALRARLRDQIMLATVGKRTDTLVIDRTHFGPYEPAARYLMGHAEALTQASRAFRGGSGMLDHLLRPKNLGSPEGRSMVRTELDKVDAALTELRAAADPLLGPGLRSGLVAAGVAEPVIQEFAGTWEATPHFQSVRDLILKEGELLALARAILENMEAAHVEVGPGGRLLFKDLKRFARQQELGARMSKLVSEANQLNEATRIYLPR